MLLRSGAWHMPLHMQPLWSDLRKRPDKKIVAARPNCDVDHCRAGSAAVSLENGAVWVVSLLEAERWRLGVRRAVDDYGSRPGFSI